MKKSNILLVGMPATGKSTLGVMLAESLNKTFVDTDDLIAELAGMNCQQIINQQGLEVFADFENKALMSVEQKNVVISTGGSAIYRHKAIQYLKKNAITLHLSASFETLKSRIGDFETRAIVIETSMTFFDLYAERMPLYQQASNIELPTDDEGDTPAKSVVKALEALHEIGFDVDVDINVANLKARY